MHTEDKHHDHDTLLDTLSTHIENGDLDGARKYIVKNITLFPPDTQGEILAALMSEALAEVERTEKESVHIRQRAIASIEELEKLRESLQEKKSS